MLSNTLSLDEEDVVQEELQALQAEIVSRSFTLKSCCSKLSIAPGNPCEGNTHARRAYGATRLANSRHDKCHISSFSTDSTTEEPGLDKAPQSKVAIPAA